MTRIGRGTVRRTAGVAEIRNPLGGGGVSPFPPRITHNSYIMGQLHIYIQSTSISCLQAVDAGVLSLTEASLSQCQDTVTERDIRSWGRSPGLPVSQHYKVTMSVHCQSKVSILMSPKMLPGRKTPTTNQPSSAYPNRKS